MLVAEIVIFDMFAKAGGIGVALGASSYLTGVWFLGEGEEIKYILVNIFLNIFI